jgi:hypothetical protein
MSSQAEHLINRQPILEGIRGELTVVSNSLGCDKRLRLFVTDVCNNRHLQFFIITEVEVVANVGVAVITLVVDLHREVPSSIARSNYNQKLAVVIIV